VYILSEKKKGKKKRELKLNIPKGDVLLNTYHLDHLGPMISMSKLYKYLLVIGRLLKVRDYTLLDYEYQRSNR